MRVPRQKKSVIVTETQRGNEVRFNSRTFDAYARRYSKSDYPDFGRFMLYEVIMPGVKEELKGGRDS